MKKIKSKILFIFSTLILFSGPAVYGAPKLIIDFENMNGHAIVKMDEGKRDIISLEVINSEGDLDYWISGGADKDLFKFDSDKKLLSFKITPDFELPRDSNGDNVYRVSLKIKDDKKEMRQSFWIYIGDIKISGAGNQEKNQTAPGIRGKRHQRVCKDSSALNFEPRGQHDQSLCRYGEDEDKLLKEKIILLAELQNLEKKKQETSAPKKPLRKKKTAWQAKTVSTKDDDIAGNVLAQKLLEDASKKDLAGGAPTEAEAPEENLNSEEEVTQEEKTITKEEVNKEEGEKSSGGAWFFWGFIILVLAAVWFVWKSFKKEDDEIDIDRL